VYGPATYDAALNHASEEDTRKPLADVGAGHVGSVAHAVTVT